MIVYVVDAWDDEHQESVVQVYSQRKAAGEALQRLEKRPGTWYGAVVKRVVR